MKDTFFFPHDFGARTDPKLQNILMEHGCAGLGVFWCIVEQIYEQGGKLPIINCKSIAFSLHVECTMVESVVNDFGLFERDEEFFWSNSINKRLAKRAEITEKRKAAAKSRWETQGSEEQPKGDSQGTPPQPPQPPKPRTPRFVPPTVEEVEAHIKEKGYNVDAKSFVAFYESKGWFVGKSKMKSWKACLVTWNQKNNETNGKGRGSKSAPSSNVNEIWGE